MSNTVVANLAEIRGLCERVVTPFFERSDEKYKVCRTGAPFVFFSWGLIYLRDPVGSSMAAYQCWPCLSPMS